MKLVLFILGTVFMLLISCSSLEEDKKILSYETTKTLSYDTSEYFFNGQNIFKADCNVCHVSKGRRHNFLEGVVQRVGENYLKLYITRQDSLLKAKDRYAVNIKEAWGNLGNSHNFHYSEKQLLEIIEYLR
jgi:hypothetical protein